MSLQEWYYPLLKAWEHYVPVWANSSGVGMAEAVEWANAHPVAVSSQLLWVDAALVPCKLKWHVFPHLYSSPGVEILALTL